MEPDDQADETTKGVEPARLRGRLERPWLFVVAVALSFALLASSCSEDTNADAGGRSAVEGELPIPGNERSAVEAAPELDIVGDLELPDGIDDSLDGAVLFEDLAERYPEAIEAVQSSDLTSEEDFSAIYDELFNLYDKEGADSLHQFMLGSGLLQGLGLDTIYADLVLAYEDEGWEGAKLFAVERGLVNDQDELRLLLELESDDYAKVEGPLSELEVRVVERNSNQMEGAIKLDKLQSLGSSDEVFAFMARVAQLPDVVKVKFPAAAVTSGLLSPLQRGSVYQQAADPDLRTAGVVSGEGPEVTGASNWHDADLTGENVKIGVIDPDGFGGYDQLVGGDLPPADRITVMPGQDPATLARATGPHGTACAEIISEMAPGADLFLAHSTSIVAFANAIDWMIESEVDIINYSAGKPSEPIDGSGPSAAHVQRAIDAGILWVNSTGNFGLAHLDMTYSDADGNGFHEFPSGDEVLPATLNAADVLVSLVWDDPWFGSQNNYDLLLLQADADGELQVVASSRSLQTGSQGDNPSEQIVDRLEGEEVFVAITGPPTASGERLNLLGHGMDFQYSILEGSLASPADVDSVLAVGAVNWQDGVLLPYSSQGPTWHGLVKPNIVATSGVETASFAGRFFGTSASAPHAAAAAALVLEANPDFPEADIRQSLLSNAVDHGVEGVDNESGAGNLDLGDDPLEFQAVRALETSDNDVLDVPESSADDGQPAATIGSVSVSEVVFEGEDALQIDADVNLKNLQNQEVQFAGFFFVDNGRNIPLKDFNGRYASQRNTVAVGTRVEPTTADQSYQQLSLVIPLSELHLKSGEQFELKVTTSVSSELGWADYLSISSWLPIVIET